MSWTSLAEMLGFSEICQNKMVEEDMEVIARIQARVKLQKSSTTSSSCSSPVQDHTFFHSTNGDMYMKEGQQDENGLGCGRFSPDPIRCSMLGGDSSLGLCNSGILRTFSCPVQMGAAQQRVQQKQVLSPATAGEVYIPSLTTTSNRCNKRKVYDADVKEVTLKQDTHNVATTVTKRKRSSSSMIDDNSSNSSKSESKASELVQKTDYIHVRARRGQATDSHSLAERVRREKISERMKYLQDLVPGCDKITGKAGMLDEIINYVQSLQRQIEFLSMKLATVNPPYDFNFNALVTTGIEDISTYERCPVSATGVSSESNNSEYMSNLMQLQHSLETNSRVNIPLDDVSHTAIGSPSPDAFENTSFGVLAAAPHTWETEFQDAHFHQINAPFQGANYLMTETIPHNICMTR